MRLFIAIGIEKDIKGKISSIQDKFKQIGADIKYVEPENLHYNLKFIGEISEDIIPKIKETLENAVKSFEPFKIHIFGLGAFPSKNYAKVIWIGLKEGKQELIGLANEIDKQLETIGIEKERKSFTPHLTLGRVKSGKNKENLLNVLNKLENEDIGEMKVNKIILFASELTPNGPIYKEIFSVNLR